MTRVPRAVIGIALTVALVGVSGTAGAHSGGLDSNGGHYCREAGYESGACSPLDSYHCHEDGCTDYDGEVGNGGGDGNGDGSDRDVYEPVPSADSGEKMRARQMFRKIGRSREMRASWYGRAKFPHWRDANGDGCDTRQAVLISESRIEASREDDCTVTHGRWRSMYDEERWGNPSDVDIDHVVALREAWVSGAYGWSRSTRAKFANDLRFRPSLRAVTDNVNQSKGDRDPAEWMPDQATCRYVINWVQVKYRWRLKANRAERAAIADHLSGDCGSRRVSVPRRAR